MSAPMGAVVVMFVVFGLVVLARRRRQGSSLCFAGHAGPDGGAGWPDEHLGQGFSIFIDEFDPRLDVDRQSRCAAVELRLRRSRAQELARAVPRVEARIRAARVVFSTTAQQPVVSEEPGLDAFDNKNPVDPDTRPCTWVFHRDVGSSHFVVSLFLESAEREALAELVAAVTAALEA